MSPERCRATVGSVSTPASLVDFGVHERLTARYGAAVEGWLAELPRVLGALSERWQIVLHSTIPFGNMSVVIRCEMLDGKPAVLKVGPDRVRVAHEAAALRRWVTPHSPAVLALDRGVGALLIEAIEPGTPLVLSWAYPSLERVCELLTALHSGDPDASYPSVADHVAYLFDASAVMYERSPHLAALIPPELYQRGRDLALRLAADASPAVLLHGDLTPRNVLDGGPERGLVAVDPAPCLGDATFDAVDLVFWLADDVETITSRATTLATAMGADPQRLLSWCAAFAGMCALEMAESPTANSLRIQALAALAAQAK
jgi:streptomycin 6-kinase